MAKQGADHVKCTECSIVFKNKADMVKHRTRHRFGPPAATPSRDASYQPRGRASWKPLQLFVPAKEPYSSVDPKTFALASDSTKPSTQWTVIPASQQTEAITCLREVVHSIEVLRKHHWLRRSEAEPQEFGFAPEPQLFQPKRHAVALDCEMVGCRDDKGKEVSVLARLSVVDYFTGEIIIDALVQPEMRVTDWRTRYSGVTYAAMNAAVRSGQALKDVPSAQAELWKHVDQKTVIVGQSLKNDFDALRIVHLCAVDSGIMVGEAVNIPTKSLFGLKATCSELLGIKIQAGKRGHDSVEDSLAAREVVLFCLGQKEKVEQWAKIKREEYAIAEAKRASKLAEQRAERIAALDKKISWSREILEDHPTKEQLETPIIRLPIYDIPLDWSERQQEILRKQYEILVAPMEASWESTISHSREPWMEPLPSHKSMYRSRLPPSAQLMPGGDDGDGISLAGLARNPGLGVITEELSTLLDDPLDDSETSLLMEPMLPSSPSSVSPF